MDMRRIDLKKAPPDSKLEALEYMSEDITAYSTVISKCSQRMDMIAETKESRDTGIAKNLLSALQEVGVVNTPARQQRSSGLAEQDNNEEALREQEQHRLDKEQQLKIKRKKERHSIYKDACFNILAIITDRDNKEDTLERLQDKFKSLLKGIRLVGTDPIEIVTTLQDLLTIEQCCLWHEPRGIMITTESVLRCRYY